MSKLPKTIPLRHFDDDDYAIASQARPQKKMMGPSYVCGEKPDIGRGQATHQCAQADQCMASQRGVGRFIALEKM